VHNNNGLVAAMPRCVTSEFSVTRWLEMRPEGDRERSEFCS